MPPNPLSIFYSVPDRWQLHPSGYVNILWKCDPAAILAIGEAGNFEIGDVLLTNIQQVHERFDWLLNTDRTVVTVVVDRLYRIALQQPQPSRNNCWFNFIAAMTIKSARHTWQKIPKPQQSEDLLERLLTPTLSIQQLLTSFNPEYHPNLLVGLQAWTYKVVKYHAFADLRANGNPYFGLSNFGIVSRSSYKLMRTALLGNITPDTLDRYISTCKIFKTYLNRSKVNTHKLESHHWQEILAEVRSLSLDLTVEELCGQIDRVGSLIRAHHSLKIERSDDPMRLTQLVDTSQSSYLEPDIDESVQTFDLIFRIIDRFITSSSVEAQKILTLRHQQQLTQSQIAKQIDKDQSKVSRQLGKMYLELLECIHQQVPHPDGGNVQKNSHAIAAIEQLLAQYFRQARWRSLSSGESISIT
jgi:RNA polymerase sigma factor (sigma-70 family)